LDFELHHGGLVITLVGVVEVKGGVVEVHGGAAGAFVRGCFGVRVHGRG